MAYNEDGREQAGMGITIADYEGDGCPDIFKTNSRMTRRLRITAMEMVFSRTAPGTFTPKWTGFTWAANTLNRACLPQQRHGTFAEASTAAGPGITAVSSARGLAVGDLRNNGHLAIVISNMNAPPSLLVNELLSSNPWVAFKTVGTRSNRDGIGVRITVNAGGRKRTDEVRSGSSDISQSDLRVHFGLRSVNKIDSVEVRWPSGTVERFNDVSVDAIHTLKEGSGTSTPSRPAKH